MPTDLEAHPVIFTHPRIDRALTIKTGANNISWAYNLNTVAYATYAGEVVQVLSCNIDNLQIDGDVRSYSEMEEIYRWFLEYMQKATQGSGGDNYAGEAVKMEYPHRGWTLFIKPIALPAMHYGREVVVPSWSLQAHIEDPDPSMVKLTVADAIGDSKTELADFPNRISAGVGYRQANPFSDPGGKKGSAIVTREEYDRYIGPDHEIAGIQVEGEDEVTEVDLKGAGKQLQNMFDELLGGEHKDLWDVLGYASKPTTKTKPNSTTTRPANRGGPSGTGRP